MNQMQSTEQTAQQETEYLETIWRMYPQKALDILDMQETQQETQEIVETVSMSQGYQYWPAIIAIAIINLILISILAS
jgi:hypothetical protein